MKEQEPGDSGVLAYWVWATRKRRKKKRNIPGERKNSKASLKLECGVSGELRTVVSSDGFGTQ